MSLSKFESMLKTDKVYFFDSSEFEEIIHHYIDNGRHSLAKKAVKLGLEQHPSSVLLRLLKAELYIFEDKIVEAKKLLNELQALEPTNEEVYIQKAAVFSKEDKHKEAIESLKIALDYTDDIADVTSLLAMEYLFLDNFEDARLNFAKCLEVDFEDYSSLYNVVYCFDMDEKHAEAIVFLKSYIDKNPYCEIAWHQLGRQYMVLKNYEEALTAFDYAVIIDESFIGGYIEKAKTLEELERYGEAIENYMVTVELDDPTAYVYLRVGECYLNLNMFSKAVEFYKKATNEDPLLDKAWLALTEVYFQKEDFSKSLYYMKKVLSIDEFNPMYWRKYGEINLKLSFFEEAINAFKKCLSLDDKSLEIWVALVDIQYFIGHFEEALASLVQAKNFYKETAEIEYRFFGLLLHMDKQEEGLLHLKNALALDFEFHTVIKELYAGLFKMDEVIEIIENFPSVK
ncbi:tetratricopeptide repeat protein [Flavicella sediminum]|uniref:tetratricopeptide repeat protein n=1 Tax=Flavicella sediminum TaxID=2585141 RepID=UPI00111EB995|nr:tetratricopeptide repeat protein [Flavicella sediminum]